MDWTTPLKAQQTDFIQRLKSAKLLHCDEKGQHSELTVISDERSKPLRNFCWEMIRKYKPNDPQNYLMCIFSTYLKCFRSQHIVDCKKIMPQ